MRRFRFRTALPRHPAWLLWLALLLPLAQSAAAWHALSHPVLEASADADGKRALHSAHCDLCLSAATLGGGALPGDPPCFAPLSLARHEPPQPALSGVRLAFVAPAYLSRAPPHAPR